MYYSCSKQTLEPMMLCQSENASGIEIASQMTDEVLQSLTAAQERKLGNIARELHDDICQRLAMLSLKIEKAAKTWATGQGHVGQQLEQIRQQCSDLMTDVQALSHELHPSILDNLGLVTAIRNFCWELSEQCDASIEFTNRNVPASLPREVSLSLFRLVQEALHNSVKYSGVNHFHVHLQAESEGLELEVRDRGVGFDASILSNKGGLGLVSMRERIRLLNGTIAIDSRPNGGTRIRAWVPVSPKLAAPSVNVS